MRRDVVGSGARNASEARGARHGAPQGLQPDLLGLGVFPRQVGRSMAGAGGEIDPGGEANAAPAVPLVSLGAGGEEALLAPSRRAGKAVQALDALSTRAVRLDRHLVQLCSDPRRATGRVDRETRQARVQGAQNLPRRPVPEKKELLRSKVGHCAKGRGEERVAISSIRSSDACDRKRSIGGTLTCNPKLRRSDPVAILQDFDLHRDPFVRPQAFLDLLAEPGALLPVVEAGHGAKHLRDEALEIAVSVHGSLALSPSLPVASRADRRYCPDF